MKRRDLFKVGAVTGAALVVPARQIMAAATGEPLSVPAFAVPLTIPPVLRPVRRTADTDHYEIHMRQSDVEIVPGTTTRVLTYNGSFPGPTIQVWRGRRAIVRHTNTLDVPTSTHLHGGHVPPQSDGYPTDVIATGASKSYLYPNEQPAATLWYHDHAHHQEAENVFRGLSGFYLVRDLRTECQLGLPSGRFDVPLVLRDIRLDDAAQIVYVHNDFEGRRTVLVNGRPQPYFPVAARKYRFRLLNAANDRAFKLRLSDGAELTQIASDGGLLARPNVTPAVDLFPGERVEVVVDFSRYPVGTQLVLQNDYGEVDATRAVMRFDVVRHARDWSRVPDHLADIPGVPTATVTRDLTMAIDPKTYVFLLNGRPFDPDRVDYTVRRGSTEIWRITNTDPFGIPHNLHLHLVQFRVLDRNGTPPGPAEAGWKDTVTVMPGETVRIAATFTGYTGRYVYHCHLIDHATQSMMGQFEVVT